MYLKELKLWNFRKYKSENNLPGLTIEFKKGLNLIVGENDSGKSAIVDAIKIILQTQSGEYIKINDDDFYCDNDNSCQDFKIECLFDDLSENEGKNFLEWIQLYKEEDITKYRLRVIYICYKENSKIFSDLKAGFSDDGINMDSRARELLKCIYLKPLRDAEYDLKATRNSRLSQILLGHPAFACGEEHELVKILSEANKKIEDFFCEEDGTDVKNNIVDHLNQFSNPNFTKDVKFSTSGTRLKQILEGMSLSLSDIKPGLGSLNLLFIATELLLLDSIDNGSLKLVLIEEIESHLHPQAQLRLIDYIQNEYDNEGVQFVLTTHSPNVASKVNLKNIILCRDSKGYSLSPDKTKLNSGDYLFLQRFLDVTKSNMFFSQGLIFVEGVSEYMLLPTISNVIDIPISNYGVSIINVESTAFLQYSNIFLREQSQEVINIPISIITDCDVRPILNENNEIEENNEKIDEERNRKITLYNHNNIKSFVSPKWTFEYVLALSKLRGLFYKSVLLAKKIQNSDIYPITDDKIEEVNTECTAKFKEWKELGYSKEKIAYYIYNDLMLCKTNKISKAIVAQCLSVMLIYEMLDYPRNLIDTFDIDLYRKNISVRKKGKLKSVLLNDELLKYLIDAIKYATTKVNKND